MAHFYTLSDVDIKNDRRFHVFHFKNDEDGGDNNQNDRDTRKM